MPSLSRRLAAWALHHRQALLGTLRAQLANPLASLMTWLMLGIALALPSILYVLLASLANLSGDWGGEPRISLYLHESVAEPAASALAQNIGALAEVKSVTFISRASALAEFQRQSGFGEALAALSSNPLPHVIEAAPAQTDPASLAALVQLLEAKPGVDSVTLDLEWLERLFALLAFAQRLVLALALVLGAGMVLAMGNTIRLAILNRRQEIEIVKLVGGTNGFVRRPFLYLGFWYGLGGSLMALLLTWVSVLFLSPPLARLAQGYQKDLALAGLGCSDALLLLLLGISLGVLGAAVAVGRHLSDIEPR